MAGALQDHCLAAGDLRWSQGMSCLALCRGEAWGWEEEVGVADPMKLACLSSSPRAEGSLGVSWPVADWISECYVHYFAFCYEQPRWIDVGFAGDLRRLVPD